MDAMAERNMATSVRVMSSRSGSSVRLGSRLALSKEVRTSSPAGIVTSPSRTGAAVHDCDGEMQRPVESEQLLHGRRQAFGLGAQQLQLIGVGGERAYIRCR